MLLSKCSRVWMSPFPPLYLVLCHVCSAKLTSSFPMLEAAGCSAAMKCCGKQGIWQHWYFFSHLKSLLLLSLAGFRLHDQIWGLEGADGVRGLSLGVVL